MNLSDPIAGLAYPRRLQVPEEVPAVGKVHDPHFGTTFVVLPTAIYALCHYEGWQECLFQFGQEGIDVEHREVAGVSIKLSDDALRYTMLGLQDGFDQCKSRIAGLRRFHSLDELRKIAMECYKPLPQSTIRPRLNGWPEGALGKPATRKDYAESRLVTRPIQKDHVKGKGKGQKEGFH